MTILKGEPGAKYRIMNNRPEQTNKTEIAEADENGVIRDEDGKSYSSGAYAIIEKTEEDNE